MRVDSTPPSSPTQQQLEQISAGLLARRNSPSPTQQQLQAISADLLARRDADAEDRAATRARLLITADLSSRTDSPSPSQQQLEPISAELIARRDAEDRAAARATRARLLASSPAPRPSVNPGILAEVAAIREQLLASRQARADIAARAAARAASRRQAATGRQQAAAPALQEDAPSIDLPAAVSDFTQDQACMRRYFAACRGTLSTQSHLNVHCLTLLLFQSTRSLTFSGLFQKKRGSAVWMTSIVRCIPTPFFLDVLCAVDALFTHPVEVSPQPICVRFETCLSSVLPLRL